MFDAKGLLDQFMGVAETYAGKENIDKLKGAIASNPGMAKAAGVGLAAVLLGTRSGRRVAGSAAKLGGLAVVGGLAYQAWQNWQRSGDAQAAGAGGEALPPPGQVQSGEDEQERAKGLLVAMIHAARADGHIDSIEQQRIHGKLGEAGIGAEAKAFLLDAMTAPLDVESVAKFATTPALGVELYTASCMAIDLDNADERAWLDALATRLQLDPKLTEEIEKAVAAEHGSD